MGMNNYACHGDVIENENVLAICPEAYYALMGEIDKDESHFDEVARQYEHGDDPTDEIENAMSHLCNEFANRTGGLQLSVGYHECEDGGDEVDGGFFTIENAYVKNPLLAKLEKDLENEEVTQRKFWTTFG